MPTGASLPAASSTWQEVPWIGRPIGMHARNRPNVGDAAIAQQRNEHRDDVVDAIERIERAAKTLGTARIERRR